jgi:hypothetical protein
MSDVSLNFVAILVATIAGMGIGALWYSPVLLGNQWMKAMGKNKEELGKGANTAYMWSGLGTLLLAYILAHFVDYAGATSAMLGALTGFWAWLGFVVPTGLNTVVYEGRSKNIYWINMGYHLVEFVVMGAILAAWV